MTHSNHAWSLRALFIGIFFAWLGASAQDAANVTPGASYSPLPVAPQAVAPQKIALSLKADRIEKLSVPDQGLLATTALKPGPDGVIRLTLDEAQQAATGASNPLLRLGELQVEAARQHRLGVEAEYFPNLSSSYTGLHFNKQPGQVLSLAGGRQVSVNIINKDQNFVNLLAVQPLTPLFSVYQLVKIAQADENITRSKAGMPVAETASKVEKNFFGLLVAQRELTGAKADAAKIQAKWLTTSSSGITSVSPEQEKDLLDAEKAVIGPASKVKELTASLNQMIGLPEETKLDLVPPEPLVENISLSEAIEKATANPEVIEAEQTSIKAHAGLALAKLTYVPTVAVLGGYTNQTSINLVFPRAAGYIGTTASWTIFDFGKREHGVKESKANAEAADLGVQLTKAKVAGAVKSSYLELDRSRQLYQLARRMVSAAQVVEVSYKPESPEVESARAKMDADMFRAELEYRQAYAKVKTMMGAQ